MRIHLFCFALAACIPSSKKEANEPAAGAQPSQAIPEAWSVEFAHSTATKQVSEMTSIDERKKPVTIGNGYATPWHGRCDEATRVERSQPIAEAIRERQVELDGTTKLRFGAGDARIITLTCAKTETPPLELVVGNLGNFAMTCHEGVCHTMKTD